MKLHSLIRDPVFQLNLLLWMAKEQPKNEYVVKPVFFESGFQLFYIQHPFPFPPESMSAIDSSDLSISKHPEPELLLRRSTDQHALYFEAKAESFSPESTTARQARGHLLAVGDAFAEVFAPLESCLLCYVLPEERRDLMVECLAELTEQMTEQNLSVGETSVHGLAIENQDLLYIWDHRFKQHSGIVEDSIAVMTGLSEDTDPSPLFLVYSVEDYPDKQNQNLHRRAMIDQIHALLVCALNALPPNTEYERSAEAVLMEMTDGVYEYIGRERQKQMRRLVRNNVFRRIADYAKDRFDDVVSLESSVLRIQFPTKIRKSSFLDWFEDFKKTTFSAEKPVHDPQPRLFDDDEE
ncbi:MAG: hypothetical protein IID44_29560 [Planctomycetes bacterium]|nr:hypothetical protein [Planctomycetota bacterium]